MAIRHKAVERIDLSTLPKALPIEKIAVVCAGCGHQFFRSANRRGSITHCPNCDWLQVIK